MGLSRYAIVLMASIFLGLISGNALLPPRALANSTDLTIPYFDNEDMRISVDGKLDESVWEQVPYYRDFTVADPDRGEAGRYETHVTYFYTRRGLYVGMRNEQPEESLLPRLSSRDSFVRRDSMQIVVDPTGKGLYAYWFSVSLGGSVGDGVVLPERVYRRNWDGAWYGNAIATSDGWTAELFIPWAIMDVPPAEADVRKIGIYVRRTLGELGERWSYPYLPNSQNRFLSALNTYEIGSLPQTGQYSLFPFTSATRDDTRGTTAYRAGLDAFWRPSSSLQLSATISPDFGQVEADEVVVNLTAFETFFPEKRLFFLENQSVFSTINRQRSSTTMLNTRRIGSSIGSRRGAPDALEGISSFDRRKPVDLVGAVKATGQTGAFRYGMLAAIEDDTEVSLTDATSVAGRDFGVARVLHESTANGGRCSLGWLGTITAHPNRRAITQGVDVHLLSRDGRLSLDGLMMTSDVEDARGFGFMGNATFAPEPGHAHKIEFDYTDRRLNLNDLGFLARLDQMSFWYRYELRETHLPGLRQRSTEFTINEARNLDQKRIGGELSASRKWSFNDNSAIRLNITYKPEFWDDRNSRGFGDYKRASNGQLEARWNTDEANAWMFGLRGSVQQEHEGGYKQSYRGEVTFRPSGRYSLSLRAGYTHRDAWLIHDKERSFTAVEAEQWSPRFVFDTFFTARQQLQLQLQWIGVRAHDQTYWEVPASGGELRPVSRPIDDESDGFAISKLTLQARYRWEIAPLSDLFVVYSRGGRLAAASPDDGFGSLFGDAFSNPTNELLVVKLRYRFGHS